MKIGELAKAAHSTPETIRYYEKEGLLPAPERNTSNYRSYGPVHLERLRFIRNCRALDMTHEEIRVLLGAMDAPGSSCGPANAMVDAHIGHVDARIAELLALKGQLTALREQCQSGNNGACGILQGLATLETEPGITRHTHLG